MKNLLKVILALCIVSMPGVAAAEDTLDTTAYQTMAITLFYQDGNRNLVQTVAEVPKQTGIGKAALRMLADSPALREKLNYYDLFPVLPQGITVIGMTIRDGIAKVDIGESILSYSSKESESAIFGSIIYTLTAFDNIEKVDFLVNGKNPGILKYGTDLSRPVGREDIDVAVNAGEVVIEAE